MLVNEKTKAQIGMEYLGVYGWVILFGLIIMGILIFVMSGFNYQALNKKCLLFSMAECSNVYLYMPSGTNTLTINLTLRNAGPDAFKITELKIKPEHADGSFGLEQNMMGSATSIELLPGKQTQVNATNLQTRLVKGEYQKLVLNGKYQVCKDSTCSSDMDFKGVIVERIE
ncbi:MAG: hypothetical protein N3E37_04445 [Candidatus Micrarchaeota archaeon]|nr:hypothetical protein [Candidatus Micrarchaeota archaeon]